MLLAIKDFRFDGVGIDADRSRQTFYVAAQPVMRKWGNFLAKKTWISSSQVLHMLIGSGHLSPIRARLACWFLGFLNAEMKRVFRAENFVAASDASGIVQFKMFLIAAAFAGAHNYHLFVEDERR